MGFFFVSVLAVVRLCGALPTSIHCVFSTSQTVLLRAARPPRILQQPVTRQCIQAV